MSAVQAFSQEPIITSHCSTSSIPFPKIPGLQFEQVQANLVQDYTKSLGRGEYIGHEAWNVSNLGFCNVSLTYTHTGHNDPINLQVWLPLGDDWNGRMVGVGGGGYSAGLFEFSQRSLAGAVSEGYVALSTDAGHDADDPDPDNWALTASGEVDMYRLENFAHVAQGDAATIGKLVSESFYGSKPKYSYWNGCSTGGRQGLMLAQRNPNAYDGILAMAPATNWAHFIPSLYWPQFIMNQLKEYPHECELSTLTAAAIMECDTDDGVVDGVISDPDACAFNPFDLVGQVVECPSSCTPMKISAAAAKVAAEAWSGPKTVHGDSLWYGVSPEAPLTGSFNLANTFCEEGKGCHAGAPFPIASSWLTHFVANNPKLDLATLTHMSYEKLFNESVTKLNKIMGSNDADLSRFRNTGGKMLTVHGLADQVIPPGGTKEYYETVLSKDPKAPSYFKYFEAPGFAHCYGGPGPFPGHIFDDLVAWVEEGKEPKTLLATTEPNEQGEVFERPLCQYPLVARYAGTGDPRKAQSYYCAESYLSATPIKILLKRARKALQNHSGSQTTARVEK
ncbi:hypothetical protein H2198_006356 [Neophaeococcomyces mojaviensis]|uniref:Uncharacterized protein n=1 Tax=Neophaeococcomyces mojaviensis TaxID=3383035 RepID=A0ACC3A303_9EURO|nr:hypothetical protein H2198_006356 [Knufia sp. JES_112]